MCLPVKSDQPDTSSGSQTRSILGLGVLTLVVCLAGPAVAGAVGALGISLLAGAGGVIPAIALCFAVPGLAVARRRRGTN